MGWLHRLNNDRLQVGTERCKVNFVAQLGREALDQSGSIVLATVEAPVDDPLDAGAQWIEQRRRRQRLDSSNNARRFANQRPEQTPQRQDEPQIDDRQRNR